MYLFAELYNGLRFLATGFFDMKIYQKSMNKYLYIPPFSEHFKIIMTSVIMSEFKCYCIICTTHEENLKLKRAYYNRLLARGYTPGYLYKSFIEPLDR